MFIAILSVALLLSCLYLANSFALRVVPWVIGQAIGYEPLIEFAKNSSSFIPILVVFEIYIMIKYKIKEYMEPKDVFLDSLILMVIAIITVLISNINS